MGNNNFLRNRTRSQRAKQGEKRRKRLFQESQQWKNKKSPKHNGKKIVESFQRQDLAITERHEFHIEKIDLKPQNKRIRTEF